MKVDLELKGYSPKTVEQLHTDEIRNYLHYLIVIEKYSQVYIHLTHKDIIDLKSPFDMMDSDKND